MDVIDRFQSGLFVRHFNANPRFIPPPQPSTNIANSVHVERSIELPTPHTDPDQETPLPLLSVSINVDLNGRLSTTNVTQKFTNASSLAAQNARYLFPIYDGSVVTSFKCWVGPHKLLKGEVKPKEVARADFQQAVSRHKAAVLLEEMTPEIFELNLGNIPPQTTVKVEIAYTGLLKVDISTGGLVLSIPTSVAPRYGTAPEEHRAADPLPTEGLRVNIQASMPAAIRKMESGTHPISVEIGAVSHQSFHTFAAGASSDTFDPSKARATLADRSAVLDKDFILFITLSSSREFMQSQAVAASQPENSGRSTVAISINPGSLFQHTMDTDDFNGEIIFMVDRSGSMETKIPSLIDVMNVFLRSLPQQCSFNIASFGSSVSWLWPASRAYKQEQLDIAAQHVETFQANFGGTEILSALQSVLDYHDQRLDVPTNVILLTDGEVWDVDRVIRFAKDTASNPDANIRFFALGIGNRVSHRLVEGIGQQGGGCAEIVAESSPESWKGRVIQMLKAALTPPRLRCAVNIDELRPIAMETFEASKSSDDKLELPPCIQAPHIIPMLNAFSQFSLFYMLDCDLDSLPETLSVTVSADKGEEKFTAQLPLQKCRSQSGIHHLAAKALMNDYETGQSWMHDAKSALKSTDPPAFERLLEQQTQRLGQQWSITSKWTSYVAIDHDTAQRHEVLLCKADSVEVSELTRPRRFRPASLDRWDNAIQRRSSRRASLDRWDNAIQRIRSSRPRNHKSGNDIPSTGERHGSSYTPSGRPPPPPSLSPMLYRYSRRPPTSRSAMQGHGGGRIPSPSLGLESAAPLQCPERSPSRSDCCIPENNAELEAACYQGVHPGDSTNAASKSQLQSVSSASPPPKESGILNRDVSRPRALEEEPPAATTTTSIDPTNIFSLSRILSSQGADGEFRIKGTDLQPALAAQFKTVIHFQKWSPVSSQDQEAHSIDLNVLAIVYITTRHVTLKPLWELQVAKARRWIRTKLAELWPPEGESSTPSQEMLKMAVENLESMARGELLDKSEVWENAEAV